MLTCTCKWYTFSGGSRNFRTGGAVEFFGSGNCFDAPSHIPYVFVVRVVTEKQIVHIVC